MNNEFDWWLLIVGLVGGAGLVWLVLTAGRGETGADDGARQEEVEWIATALRRAGTPVDEDAAERVLALHREWETGAADIDWDWTPVAETPAEAGVESSDGIGDLAPDDGVAQRVEGAAKPSERGR